MCNAFICVVLTLFAFQANALCGIITHHCTTVTSLPFSATASSNQSVPHASICECGMQSGLCYIVQPKSIDTTYDISVAGSDRFSVHTANEDSLSGNDIAAKHECNVEALHGISRLAVPAGRRLVVAVGFGWKDTQQDIAISISSCSAKPAGFACVTGDMFSGYCDAQQECSTCINANDGAACTGIDGSTSACSGGQCIGNTVNDCTNKRAGTKCHKRHNTTGFCNARGHCDVCTADGNVCTTSNGADGYCVEGTCTVGTAGEDCVTVTGHRGRWVASECSFCGNGVLEGKEECDGTPLFLCEDVDGFSGGELKCHSNCSLDTSKCTRTVVATKQVTHRTQTTQSQSELVVSLTPATQECHPDGSALCQITVHLSSSTNEDVVITLTPQSTVVGQTRITPFLNSSYTATVLSGSITSSPISLFPVNVQPFAINSIVSFSITSPTDGSIVSAPNVTVLVTVDPPTVSGTGTGSGSTGTSTTGSSGTSSQPSTVTAPVTVLATTESSQTVLLSVPSVITAAATFYFPVQVACPAGVTLIPQANSACRISPSSIQISSQDCLQTFYFELTDCSMTSSAKMNTQDQGSVVLGAVTVVGAGSLKTLYFAASTPLAPAHPPNVPLHPATTLSAAAPPSTIGGNKSTESNSGTSHTAAIVGGVVGGVGGVVLVLLLVLLALFVVKRQQRTQGARKSAFDAPWNGTGAIVPPYALPPSPRSGILPSTSAIQFSYMLQTTPYLPPTPTAPFM